jgi:DNA excision repair protein ERCC-2
MSEGELCPVTMTVRFDDDARTVVLSVRDLVEHVAPSGDLRVDVVQRSASRLEQGRRAHVDWQRGRAAVDPRYRAEVSVRADVEVEGWRVTIMGRVDGLIEEEDRKVVEEIKSSLLEGDRLCRTGMEDWASHVEQLQAYLWVCARQNGGATVGRLVLVSVLDRTRHVLNVDFDEAATGAWIFDRLRGLVNERSAHLRWLIERRSITVTSPFAQWRSGQESMADVVQWNLDAGQDVLVQAPTGFGKTAPILTGALRHALANDKQVFWATARTTHQGLVMDTLGHLVDRGVEVRGLVVGSKERVCLNDVVVCRGDACRYAASYWDKIRETRVIQRVLSLGAVSLQGVSDLATEAEVCPYELALDASAKTDLLVGDYNYVLDPSVRIRRHFGESAKRWVVVVDEAHHLLERARSWRSPFVEVRHAREALKRMRGIDPARYAPFIALAEDIEGAVRSVIQRSDSPGQDGLARVELPEEWLAHEAAQIDALALSYLKVELETRAYLQSERDPWLDLARSVLRFRQQWEESEGVVRVTVASRTKHTVGLLCVDVSNWLGAQLARLGGVVGCSATLSPADFYMDVLGLPSGRTDYYEQPDEVSLERRRVVVAPYVSTLFKDREAHAPMTASLLQECIEAVPGNVAVYFPSFSMLEELTDRWSLEGRSVMRQPRQLLAAERDAWLDQLITSKTPVVLAAVLGGVFAEGIDLPAGSLDAIFVTGPALPPVGLERDLLKAHYEETFEQGHLYASLIPGLTKVVQAAGRLHRRPTDRGAILLVGRRFRWRDVRSLLPDSWYAEVVEDPVMALRDFFAEEE